jgi:hypothetical protein
VACQLLEVPFYGACRGVGGGDDRKAARVFRWMGRKRQERCRFFAVAGGCVWRLKIKVKIEGVGLTASGFAFGELLDEAPPSVSKSSQGLLLLVGPLLRRGSLTPVSFRGPAAIRHPWRGAALAASMRLGPRNETCAQPAPKSR